eukprot:2001201-Rhodomonas_salina.1
MLVKRVTVFLPHNRPLVLMLPLPRVALHRFGAARATLCLGALHPPANADPTQRQPPCSAQSSGAEHHWQGTQGSGWRKEETRGVAGPLREQDHAVEAVDDQVDALFPIVWFLLRIAAPPFSVPARKIARPRSMLRGGAVESTCPAFFVRPPASPKRPLIPRNCLLRAPTPVRPDRESVSYGTASSPRFSGKSRLSIGPRGRQHGGSSHGQPREHVSKHRIMIDKQRASSRFRTGSVEDGWQPE